MRTQALLFEFSYVTCNSINYFIILWITSSVFITENLYLFMIFVQFPFNPKPNSGNQNSDFFFYIFFCLVLKYVWPTTLCKSLLYNIVFQYFCTFKNYHHENYSYCQHIMILCTYWLCYPHWTFHNCDPLM